MAGSLEHVLHGWSNIGNLGDAQEAVGELLWLVLSEIGEDRAKALLLEKFYPMYRKEMPYDAALEHTIACLTS